MSSDFNYLKAFFRKLTTGTAFVPADSGLMGNYCKLLIIVYNILES